MTKAVEYIHRPLPRFPLVQQIENYPCDHSTRALLCAVHEVSYTWTWSIHVLGIAIQAHSHTGTGTYFSAACSAFSFPFSSDPHPAPKCIPGAYRHDHVYISRLIWVWALWYVRACVPQGRCKPVTCACVCGENRRNNPAYASGTYLKACLPVGPHNA